MSLIKRNGNRPLTGATPPHLQFTDQSPEDIHEHMASWALKAIPATTPEVREEPTHISVPSSRALWLDEAVLADPKSFMPPPGSREFAHLHEDGSWHIVVSDKLVEEIVSKGWGERHPWYDRGVLEVMIYAPRNLAETETVKSLVLESIRHASNGTVEAFSNTKETRLELS